MRAWRRILPLVIAGLSIMAGCDEDGDTGSVNPGAPGGSVMTFDAAVVGLAGQGGPGAPAGGVSAGGGLMTGGTGGTFGAGSGGVMVGVLPDAGATTGDLCNGLQTCAGACVNTASDPKHCGMCGRACGEGQRCEASRCVGAGADGCSDTPVSGLSLSEIAVYQSVKAPIMQNQTAIARAQRKVDVVQGRDAVFRVHVTPGAGWTPRQVAARLTLTGAGASAPRRFSAQLTPTKASSDAEPTSTFQIKVPADALTADTSYAVSLVECSANAAPGAGPGARFPADGFAPLEARATGVLRLHIVPLETGGALADTSEAALEIYRKRIFALYPVTKLELTVGPPLRSTASSMCSHLTAIRSRRTADNAPVDLYYYGLTPGLSGGQSGCSNALSSASQTAKTAAGWQTIAEWDRGERGASTMAHELGHSHGRLHAPCGVQDPDPNYPHATANTGVWGYDARSETFLPPTRKDMMSYCPNPDRTQAWVSDYTYQALVTRIGAVNALVGQSFLRVNAPKVAWRMLVVDGTGAHWGEYPLLLEGAPEGVALTAIVHDSNGPMSSIEVYKEELEAGVGESAYMLTLPEPRPGWQAIEVPGLLPLQRF
jgi:hypothetical protein